MMFAKIPSYSFIKPRYHSMKFIFIFGTFLTLTACSVNKEIKNNQVIAQRVNNTPGVIEHHVIEQPDHQLHYVSALPFAPEKSKTSVLFVHGTPGDWGTFARYFEDDALKADFHLNSVDRPGWGKSGYPGDDFPVYLSSQSALLAPVLEDIWQKNQQQKIIVVGHSLGGSLVPKLAADYPHFIKGVVVLAGDLDPELSESRWFNKVLDWTPDFLLPDMWNNSNNEVIAIRPSLESLQAEFATIKMPITVVQGTDDGLVRPGSATKAPVIFSSAKVDVFFIEGAGHIIDLTHVEDVKKAIYNVENRFTP
ncbi:alpha/beta hydrolase [Marinomonas agarivorans]|nr:alpha/beta hydrolase [Marinomonas agarivorans]